VLQSASADLAKGAAHPSRAYSLLASTCALMPTLSLLCFLSTSDHQLLPLSSAAKRIPVAEA
jgi:hypothetical protein